jgi:hypothetical protein
MTAVRLRTFGGMIPAVDRHLLPDTAAVYSENAYLYSGRLRGLPQPDFVRACTTGTSKVYRIPNNYTDADFVDDSLWLEFPNFNTDVVRSPVVGDTYDRYYWAGAVGAPRYNTRARIANGDSEWLLGIPLPNAVSVSPASGVSTVIVSRSYAVTFVSAYGEEGPAQVSSAVNGKQDDTWTVTLPTADADDIGGPNRNLTKMRIYRTVTSASGQATYFFVAEVDITDTTYADTASDTVVTANEQLASLNWTAPPTDLEGWIMMPNGILAGWKGNELWFSEPYRPHAWPASYALAVEYPIVGLGIINQTLVVCTKGFPMTATGSTPGNITTSTLTSLEPCLSRGSIISSPEGVYYASPNGLVLVANGGALNITRQLILKDDWNQLLKVATLRAARLGNAYYCYGSARFGVFQEDAFQTGAFASIDFAGSYTGALIDPNNERVAFNTLSTDTPTVNVMSDAWSGDIYIIRDNNLYRIDLAAAEPVSEVYTWRSKVFQSEDKKNFVAMKVYFETLATTPEQAAERNNDLEQELAADQYGLVRVYADGVLRMTRELRTSGELMRLPSGFKAEFWQLEFESRVDILSVQMATSVKELSRV